MRGFLGRRKYIHKISISDIFFIVNPSGWIIPLSSSGVRFTRNDNSAGKMKKNSLFLAENNLFFYLSFSSAEKIKYLTMTDAKLVWMPDTFFR
jgi:hypothetical protein